MPSLPYQTARPPASGTAATKNAAKQLSHSVSLRLPRHLIPKAGKTCCCWRMGAEKAVGQRTVTPKRPLFPLVRFPFIVRIAILTAKREHFTICLIGMYNVALCGSYQKRRSGNSGSVTQNPSSRYLHGIVRWHKRTGPLRLTLSHATPKPAWSTKTALYFEFGTTTIGLLQEFSTRGA